jgi:hypothetical protein
LAKAKVDRKTPAAAPAATDKPADKKG